MIALLVLAAGGYAVATVGMKLASGTITLMALGLIAVGLAGAALAEVMLLRNAALPVIYIAVVTVESLLVLVYALAIGERLSLSQLSGAVLVLSGFAIVTLAE